MPVFNEANFQTFFANVELQQLRVELSHRSAVAARPGGLHARQHLGSPGRRRRRCRRCSRACAWRPSTKRFTWFSQADIGLGHLQRRDAQQPGRSADRHRLVLRAERMALGIRSKAAALVNWASQANRVTRSTPTAGPLCRQSRSSTPTITCLAFRGRDELHRRLITSARTSPCGRLRPDVGDESGPGAEPDHVLAQHRPR